jgi:hypothetical protein
LKTSRVPSGENAALSSTTGHPVPQIVAVRSVWSSPSSALAVQMWVDTSPR